MTATLCDPAVKLSVKRLESLAGNKSLRAEWEELSGDNLFLSWDWLECWWRHYGPDGSDVRKELCVLTMRDDRDRLIGVAPWYLERSLLKGHVIRFLGDGEVLILISSNKGDNFC